MDFNMDDELHLFWVENSRRNEPHSRFPWLPRPIEQVERGQLICTPNYVWEVLQSFAMKDGVNSWHLYLRIAPDYSPTNLLSSFTMTVVEERGTVMKIFDNRWEAM